MIDGVGTVLKFLFGILNDEDYQILNTKIETIETYGESLARVESDRRKLTNEVDENFKAIQILVDSVKSTITKINNVNISLWNEI